MKKQNKQTRAARGDAQGGALAGHRVHGRGRHADPRRAVHPGGLPQEARLGALVLHRHGELRGRRRREGPVPFQQPSSQEECIANIAMTTSKILFLKNFIIYNLESVVIGQ